MHEIVVAQRLAQGGAELLGQVRAVHDADADAGAQAGGLADEPRIREPAREVQDGGLHGWRVGGVLAGAHLQPGQHGQLQRAAHALEEGLVHAHRGGSRSGTAVGQADRLEERLHLAVLAEGAVHGREDHGLRPAGGELLEGRGRGERAAAAQGPRVTEGARRQRRVQRRCGQGPPARLEVDEPAAHLVAALAERRGDGAPGDERDVVLGRGSAEEDRDHGRGRCRANARWLRLVLGHASSSAGQSPTNSTS